MDAQLMSDEEFIESFELCTFPPDNFTHRHHIWMAWIYLRKYTMTEASTRIIEGIQRFARSANLNNLYHDTITQFWIHAVAEAIETAPRMNCFSEFAAKNLALLDSKYIYRFYTKERLFTEEARQSFIEPDIVFVGVQDANVYQSTNGHSGGRQ